MFMTSRGPPYVWRGPATQAATGLINQRVLFAAVPLLFVIVGGAVGAEYGGIFTRGALICSSVYPSETVIAVQSVRRRVFLFTLQSSAIRDVLGGGVDVLDQVLTVVFVDSHAGKYVPRGIVDDAHEADLYALLDIIGLIY
jgi:hypothetical protein